MGISITPTAGTFDVSYYYEAQEGDGAFDLTGAIRNRVYRAAETQPSINVSYSNGFFIIESMLGLRYAPADDEPVGEARREDIDELLERTKSFEPDSEYQATRRDEMLQLLLHCKWHECGFTWA